MWTRYTQTSSVLRLRVVCAKSELSCSPANDVTFSVENSCSRRVRSGFISASVSVSDSIVFLIVAQMLSGAAAVKRDAGILDHCNRRVCDPRRHEDSTKPDDGDGGHVSGGAGGGGGGGGGGGDGVQSAAVPCGPSTTIDGLSKVA